MTEEKKPEETIPNKLEGKIDKVDTPTLDAASSAAIPAIPADPKLSQATLIEKPNRKISNLRYDEHENPIAIAEQSIMIKPSQISYAPIQIPPHEIFRDRLKHGYSEVEFIYIDGENTYNLPTHIFYCAYNPLTSESIIDYIKNIGKPKKLPLGQQGLGLHLHLDVFLPSALYSQKEQDNLLEGAIRESRKRKELVITFKPLEEHVHNF